MVSFRTLASLVLVTLASLSAACGGGDTKPVEKTEKAKAAATGHAQPKPSASAHKPAAPPAEGGW